MTDKFKKGHSESFGSFLLHILPQYHPE